MRVNIELSDYNCEALLAMHGYMPEDVTAYFNNSTDPYGKGEDVSELRGINIKVAYHRMDRPKELNKEYPMLDNLEQYKYDKVIEELFNSRLRDILFKF